MTDAQIYSFDPAEIDCSGEWLLYPSLFDEGFISSIKTVGQLVPVLFAKDGNKIILVAGRSRVLAAEKLGVKVSGIFVDAEDEVSRAFIHMEENRARVADDALKLNVFRFFHTRIAEKDLSQRVAPLLGMKPKARDLKLWLEWLTLPQDFDGVLQCGNFPLAAVSVFSKFSDEDKKAILPYFEKLGWSRSNAVNFLTWLYETSRRDMKSVSALISEHGLSPAKENESPKDGVARLCKAAKMLRFPVFSDLLKTKENIVGEICVGTKWRVESVGNFETGEVVLQTRFKSRDVMQKAIEDLDSIQKSDGWDKLFEIGREK
ncbi:chromosome partitioning protein, ParB family [Maridesulfovibrio ferrireducens]|uniref:Chromosome partitioning protein, ParB family n=1 Tax=Maridesulfovibrio ferrireducens TaxID=246191 RepID=A0A1G9GW57_9BACT|nr:ParB/RepB/Spo0J family partition protein [Maridesulfovibrio ferrireducens]SDL04523.1 chromosome partitioning protein, ParB family [Maridesulfovibrio ferrireducens]